MLHCLHSFLKPIGKHLYSVIFLSSCRTTGKAVLASLMHTLHAAVLSDGFESAMPTQLHVFSEKLNMYV